MTKCYQRILDLLAREGVCLHLTTDRSGKRVHIRVEPYARHRGLSSERQFKDVLVASLFGKPAGYRSKTPRARDQPAHRPAPSAAVAGFGTTKPKYY